MSSAPAERTPRRRGRGKAAVVGPRSAFDGESLARYYDLDLADDPGDLPLYLAWAQRVTGPILELGAGTGRLAVPLAMAGHAVTAVDVDGHMLKRARDGWRRERPRGRSKDGPSATGSLTLLRRDMRTLRVDERFGLVILALNTLLQLGDAASQRQAIAVTARHLRPDGVAVLDVWLPAGGDLAMYDGRLGLEWMRQDPETGDQVTKSVSARYDAATATTSLVTIFDAWSSADLLVRRVARTDVLRLISTDELRAMVDASGMIVERLAGDHQMGPWGPGVERVVLVGRLV